MKTRILAFVLVLFSTMIFAQQVKVTTPSGTTTASIYITNNGYNNGAGNVSTYVAPTGVAATSSGTLYAFDLNANVIRKILPNGFTSEFCGNSTFTSPSFAYGYADGTGTAVLFSDLTAIATDAQDNIYVMDNNRLRKITPAGVASTLIISQTEFKDAAGLCVDVSGNIYVSDTGNKRIRKVAPTGVITTIATGFTSPKGITLDASGNLYICDVTTVKKLSPSGTVTTYATGFAGASGVCIDASGRLFVTDSVKHILYVVSTSGVVSNYAGTGTGTFRDGFAGPLRTNASFYKPQGICIDPSGNKFVADTNNQRIRKVTP